jgi:hypothetical protein
MVTLSGFSTVTSAGRLSIDAEGNQRQREQKIDVIDAEVAR